MATFNPRAATVEFRRVWKRFGDVAAVRDLSFEIAAGTLTTLLGPSGCGKTTTLRLVAGLEFASEGQILIGGEDVTSLGAADRDVSMVFQSYALFPHMSVLDNVMYGPLSSGLARGQAREKAMAKLELLALAGLEHRYPSELSGGQQQRVAVARAIVLEPRVLLFDEPLSNLDAKLRRKVRDDIRDIQQRLGLTVIYVTHDQQEALAVSDHVIVMDNAVIAQQGTPDELYHRPQTRFIADFIGEANIIEGSLLQRDGAWTLERDGVEVQLGREITVPPGVAAEHPARAMVAIRPYRLTLEAQPASPAAIQRAAFVGPAREYTVAVPWGDVLVIRPSREAALRVGTAVRLVAEPGSAIVIRTDATQHA